MSPAYKEDPADHYKDVADAYSIYLIDTDDFGISQRINPGETVGVNQRASRYFFHACILLTKNKFNARLLKTQKEG